VVFQGPRGKEMSAPPKVRLNTPRPNSAFASESRSAARYVADAEDFIDSAVDHVEALVRSGYARTEPAP
jgi:hypothetical protein